MRRRGSHAPSRETCATRDGAEHGHPFDVIDPIEVAARLQRLGFASVGGSLSKVGGRPAKLARGVNGGTR